MLALLLKNALTKLAGSAALAAVTSNWTSTQMTNGQSPLVMVKFHHNANPAALGAFYRPNEDNNVLRGGVPVGTGESFN